MTTDAKMDAETLAALRGSIAKWRAIVAGTGMDDGTANCPLCIAFYEENRDANNEILYCVRCPVFARTGETDCGDTPYYDWKRACKQEALFPGGKLSYTGDTPTKIAAAQAELDFLISLLPAGEKP